MDTLIIESSDFERLKSYLHLTRELNGGVQHLFNFGNGFGASLVQHRGSYGSGQGLWEIAVLDWHEDGSYDLTYDTPVTDDVLGHLSHKEVLNILCQIEGLKVN